MLKGLKYKWRKRLLNGGNNRAMSMHLREVAVDSFDGRVFCLHQFYSGFPSVLNLEHRFSWFLSS